MGWYIEAWNVLDGYAFISEQDHRNAVKQVYHASPPYFRPLPVLDLSTALAATRGSFQEKLHTEKGEEEAFDSLTQVLELVRRSFRAGGASGSPPLPSGPVSPPPAPFSSDGALCSRLVNDARSTLTEARGLSDREKISQSLACFALDPFHHYYRSVAVQVLARLSAVARDLERLNDFEEKRSAVAACLMNTGLWASWGELREQVGYACSSASPRSEPYWWERATKLPSPEGTRRMFIEGLLFQISCPDIVEGHPYLSCLGHHLCAFSCDTGYVEALQRPEDFAYPVLAALLLQAACQDSRAVNVGELLESALLRLAEDTPDATLARFPVAEQLPGRIMMARLSPAEPVDLGVHFESLVWQDGLRENRHVDLKAHATFGETLEEWSAKLDAEEKRAAEARGKETQLHPAPSVEKHVNTSRSMDELWREQQRQHFEVSTRGETTTLDSKTSDLRQRPRASPPYPRR